MKIRSVRPEFFADPKMVGLSPLARLLYIGLWCYADDYGRGEYLPKRIEGEVFPLESIDFSGLWSELEAAGRVRRYEVDGHAYFHIPTFDRHQKPNRKWDSKLPEPPLATVSTLPTQRDDTAPAPPVVVDGDVDGGGDVVTAQTAAAARPPDIVWDTLEELFGTVSNKSSRGARNRAVALLKQSEATPDDIRYRHDAWPFHFGDATLTDLALAKHYDTLGRQPKRATPSQIKQLDTLRERHRRRVQTPGTHT